jgi:hypothetical protein
VELAVATAAIPEFDKHSKQRQKFMVWAAVLVAAFHDLLLDLEEAKKQLRSPGAILEERRRKRPT